MLRRHLKQDSSVFASVAPHQRNLIVKLLQRPDGMLSLLEQPAGFQSYAPASGEIFGILKQMKESFETNLEQSRKDEAEGAASYSGLKSAKEAEIKAAGEKVFNKEAENAEAVKKNAESKEQLVATRAALEADTTFLASLKKQCAVTDEDWEARTKMRSDEIAAVSDTIAMLESDDARDLMSKSLGLIQVRAQAQQEASVRAQAVKFLAEAGKRLNSPRVSYLATRMKFDPFGGLRDSIDGMTTALGKEKEDEIHHKDGCVEDFNENDKQTTERNEYKGDVEQEIADLESEISQLNEEEKVLMQEIADTQVEMKKVSENRESENKEFQETVADQRATQEILKKAVERLGDFYNKKAAFVQQDPVPGAAAPPPPPGFGEYKKAGGGGAMALIENIIAESASVEKDAIKAEQDAQTAYEETQDEGDKRATIGDLLNLGSMNG